MIVQNVAKAWAGDVFHHHPTLLRLAGLNVPQRDQIDVPNVEALFHATQFDVQVALNLFQCDLFPCIIKRKVHLAETADADSAFDGVSPEWFGSAGVRELHSIAKDAKMEKWITSPL